ncbi:MULTISPECIES: hypothetical protein [Halolamina]|uniref:Uncharacterized protein n=1 Tax=Halolamina pelagica TaxID=699431 RepID=A0A1I5UQS8_9EURY|nr:MULTISPECIES: hypothetical protein [Halolamina]NHX37446.1 hypothetical protein [Halolamina sp. R1-12]SFP97550.1 hypothetical protein SAMN05216277_11415 [Halolamina pelagica]
MVEYYGIISNSDIQDRLYQFYRLFVGISGLTVVVALPALSGLLYITLYDKIHGTGDEFGYYSFWRDDIGDLLMWLSIALFVAVAAVYFLRLLFWLRHVMQTSWREHTPPFESAEKEKDSIEKPPSDLLPKAERRTARWLTRGFFFYFGTVILLISFVLTVEYFGFTGAINSSIEGNLVPPELMEYIAKTIKMLPFVGDLSIFLGMLPGDGPLQKFLINGAALFFTVAIRNLSYIFENIGYVYGRAEWWRPNRFAVYLAITGFGQVVLVLLGVLFGFGG